MAINSNNSEAAIVGKAYEEPKKLVAKYSKENIPLLFLGETGSGKELFANLYMKKSEREGKKRTINCAGFSDEMLRSEFFGHVMGAFTGAVKKRDGLIKKCENGIIFLDELDSASPEFQALILRVTEQNSYSQLGSDDEDTCNTLIIVAIKNLSSILIDLQHRFAILPIPPLQPFDIPEIAEKHLKKPLKQRFLNELVSKDYPGNVRQLFKRCDKLLVEEGEEIFNKKIEKKSTWKIRFNYNRFRDEIMLWHKHIQPIIKKHDLVGISYKYKEPDGNSEGIIEECCRKFNMSEIGLYEMAYAIDRSKYGVPPFTPAELIQIGFKPEEGLRLLIKILKTMIEQGVLYDVVNFLEDIENRDKNISKSTIKKKPHLSYLLNIAPFKKAEKKFKHAIAFYHLNKNKGNKNATSEELGISIRTLNRYLEE